jgi:hypothetical protein
MASQLSSVSVCELSHTVPLEMGEMLAEPPFGGCNEQIFGKQ